MQQNILIEENIEGAESKKNKKTRINMIILAIFIITIGTIAIHYFNKNYIYNDKIAKNVYVGKINLSNLSMDEAKKILKDTYIPQNMKIKYENNSFELSPKTIDFNYDIEKVLDEAYNFNKTKSYIENVKRIVSLESGNKKIFEIKSTYNESKLDNYLKKLSKEINTEVKDADINISSTGVINITPEVIGQKVNIKSTRENINKSIRNNSFEKVDLVVEKTEPKITADMLQSVDSVLTTQNTTFNNSSPNRAHNIIRSANSTSDILLMPGEEFSYNKSTGPRSKSNGYKDAPVIVNGKIQDGSGGGVCQVSTTIYNSALYSGMDITKVRNHSLPSSYAPMGKDAAVAYDYLDLKFKNPYDHPVYIKNTVYNGVVTSKIYGSSKDKQNISIQTENIGSGNTVKTYRIYKDRSGKVFKNEYITTSIYRKK